MCVLELLRHKSDTVLELLMGERERENAANLKQLCLITYVNSGSSLVSTSLLERDCVQIISNSIYIRCGPVEVSWRCHLLILVWATEVSFNSEQISLFLPFIINIIRCGCPFRLSVYFPQKLFYFQLLVKIVTVMGCLIWNKRLNGVSRDHKIWILFMIKRGDVFHILQ